MAAAPQGLMYILLLEDFIDPIQTGIDGKMRL